MPVRVRRRIDRRGSRLAAAAVVAVLAAGCSSEVIDGKGAPASGSGSTTSAPTVPTGQVTFGESLGEVTNFLPLIADGNSTATVDVTVRVLDGLYRSSPQITYVPDADQGSATSSTVGGQQVVDVKIDPRAVWADGQPITADDYAFTLSAQRSYDPVQNGCAALLATAGYDQVERTEQVSSKELKVYFKTPYADWKGLFSGAGGAGVLLSKHVMDKGTPSDTCAAITRGWPLAEGIPLGAQNGPWLLKPENIDATTKTITLVPNPRYWGAKPKLAKLIFKTVGDGTAAVAALRNGEVDIAYPTPQLDLLSQLKQTNGVTTTVSVGSSFEHLDFNTFDGLLKYPQIRQAIGLAVDRKALVAQTVAAFGDPAQPLGNRLLLNNQTGYVDNSGQYGTPNIVAAKKLIESVGGKLGGDGIYQLGGAPLSFKVMTTVNNPLRDKTIATLAAQVRAAGIQLTEVANPDIFDDAKVPTSLAAHGFQIALFAWVGLPSLSTANSIYYSPARSGTGGQNFGRGGTAQIDTALDGIATAASSGAQVAAANATDKLLWDQLYTLPLYQKPTLLAFQNKIKGIRDNVSLAGPLWNSDDFSVR